MIARSALGTWLEHVVLSLRRVTFQRARAGVFVAAAAARARRRARRGRPRGRSPSPSRRARPCDPPRTCRLRAGDAFEGPRDRRRLRSDAFERTRAAGRRGVRARGRRRRAELRFEAAAAAAHAGGRVPPAGPDGGRLLRFRRRRLLRDGRLLRLRRDLRKRVGRARLSRTCDDAGAHLLGRRRLLRGSGGLDLLGRLGLCPVGLLLHRFCLRHRSGGRRARRGGRRERDGGSGGIREARRSGLVSPKRSRGTSKNFLWQKHVFTRLELSNASSSTPRRHRLLCEETHVLRP